MGQPIGQALLPSRCVKAPIDGVVDDLRVVGKPLFLGHVLADRVKLGL